jgi:sensor c-di-GMP phosphodiesterase-like protein
VVVGLVLLGTGQRGWSVFVLVVAVVLVGVTVREVLRTRSRRSELAEARQRVRDRVHQVRATAVSTRSASQETQAEVAGLARAITESRPPAPSSLR